MKFSWKVFLCTIVILAAGLGIGGFYLINSMFRSALDREIKQVLDESSLLRFAFETAVASYPAKYERLQDATIEQIGTSLEAGESARLIRIMDSERILYQSGGLEYLTFEALVLEPEENSKIYSIVKIEDTYYLRIISSLSGFDRALNLEAIKDISPVFAERNNNFSIYQKISIIVLLAEAVITMLLAVWLTRPVKYLSEAARNMSEGSYGYRAKKISDDELGRLTDDFNRMAETLQEKILQLQEEARTREDFVAAFAHELKTPLTAIIGYADVLRLKKLDEEKHFLSADYIYREGKRLETLSFRLLDLIVMGRYDIELVPVDVSSIFEHIKQSFESEDVELMVSYDNASVAADEPLVKTVMINLTDNAVKASLAGGCIKVTGKQVSEWYKFTVEDFGCGIPEQELNKITEAFYMVDKSRSRSRNGAGLGLALCLRIVELHKSELYFESRQGEGTKVSFVLKGIFSI